MQEVELNGSRLVRIWWLLLWRSVVTFFIGGIVFFGVLRGISALFGANIDPGVTQNGRMVTVGILYMAALLLSVRMGIKKRYAGFRLVLIDPRTHIDTSIFS